MEARLAALLVRYRLLFVLFSLVAVAAIAYGARYVWFDSDYRIFFSADNPQLLAHERMQSDYTRSDNISFILAPRDGAAFTGETLAAIEELTAAAWKIPHSIRVDSITNFQHTRAEGDDLKVADLVENGGSLSEAEIQERRAIALAEPLLVHSLISDKGHVTSVNVRLTLPTARGVPDTATPEVMAYARDLAHKFEQAHPEIKLYLMGLVPVNQAFNELAQKDSETLAPLMFVVVVLVLAVFLRTASGVLVTVAVIVCSLLVAVGFMGWVGYAANQVNVSAPTLILTLAVSDSVHLLLSYLEALGRGLPKPAAMEESLELNLGPVFFTNFTTAIGFIALNFSDSPPFLELGNIAAFGVMGTMVLSFTLLPGLMIWLPVRIRPGMGEDAHWRVVDRIGEFALARRRALFWGVLAVVLVCASFLVKNDLNDDTVEYFSKGLEIRSAFDFVEDNLTGIDSISYSLPAGGPEGIHEPAYLKKVEAFGEWLRQQPEVTHVTLFTDVIKRLNRNMHGDDPAYYRVPDERDLAAQYVLLYELSLPQGLDLNDMITFDKSATRLSVSLVNQKSRALMEFDERARRWLAGNAPELQTHGASVSLMFAHVSKRNIDSMVRGALISALLISLTMIFSLRSLKFGVLSVIPNLLPAAMAFGIWGLLVGEVNLAVAAVFSISSGIVIDDTIHFLSKYLRARRRDGKDPADAVRYSFATTGSALFVNTAVLVTGFLVLTISDFTVNSSLGFMTALIIGIALFFDLLFLPALLLRFDRQKTLSVRSEPR